MRLFLKDIFIKIRKTLGRFLSILCIVGLGLGFFAGIRNTSFHMLDTLDQYYDDTHLYDIRLVSSYGFSLDEVRYLQEQFDDFLFVPTYSIDVEVSNQVVRVHTLHEHDMYVLEEGRYPKEKDECLVETGYGEIGDTISLQHSMLGISSCQIVGTGMSSVYIGSDKGTSMVGDGSVDTYLYILEDAVISPYYTEVYVSSLKARSLSSYEDDYQDFVTSMEVALEKETDVLRETQIQRMADLVTGGDTTSLLQVMDQPEFYTFLRTDLAGYSSFHDDALRVDSIAALFPIFFLLVAILVCLNTMVRFVEEERGQFGILKSLGYSNFLIVFEYIIYVSLATLVGAMIGLLIGCQLLPRVVYSIYSFSYNLPEIQIQIPLFSSVMLIVFAFLLMNGITLYASYQTLREQPASLLRPKVVAGGKNIWLEHISFIWEKLNFINKVTMRNIFRYKKRLLMTVLGVAGCMGLLVTGFGLKDSIGGILPKQFDDIFTYDSMVVLRSEEDIKTVEEKLLDYTDQYGQLMLSNYMFETSDKEHSVTLMVAKNWDTFSSYIHLYDAQSKEELDVSQDHVLISSKMASLLGVSKGDFVTFYDRSGQEYQVLVGGVIENYVGHYMMMDEVLYERLIGEAHYTCLVLSLKDHSEDFTTSMLALDSVLSVSLMEDSREQFDTMIDSLNQIVLVIILAASLLAFVVLYNLVIINITERRRELATLKVLGFYDREVSIYVYKEILLEMVLGIVVGCAFGVLLHSFVMDAASMDEILFPKKIEWYSYLISALLTVLFALITFIFTNRKLYQIDMIESLKSVE